ncbi:MAG: hypothetical protein KMY55_09945 [Dethiosulfatibacter sp.]|nr:hypothetical protein [Dethiosulfatibacter sp.]
MNNKHYERLDNKGFVVKTFSDAFEKPLATDMFIGCGGRHYNPIIRRLDGLPLYKYIDGIKTETSDLDFVDELNPANIAPTLEEVVDDLIQLLLDKEVIL